MKKGAPFEWNNHVIELLRI